MSQDIIKGFNEVRRNSFGSRFYKVDLHFHTPASSDATAVNKYCFDPYCVDFPEEGDDRKAYIAEIMKCQEKAIMDCEKKAEEIVKKLIEEKVGLVAVTDHNAIGTLYNDHKVTDKLMDLDAMTWYELLSDKAESINKQYGKHLLEVLPGSEISTAGVHILAIFPPQKPKKRAKFIIEELLDELGLILENWGDLSAIGNIGIHRTVQLIEERGGFPVIAHIDGTGRAMKGLYEVTSNSMRVQIANKSLPAVEVVKTSTLSSKVNAKSTLYAKFKEIRIKEGLEPLAYFQGSDAHRTEDIAKRYSYVKMSRPSYSGLVDSIQSPSSRILLRDQHKSLTKGLFLYGVELDYGYFKKQYVRFNRHFNCVIGKRESGRSSFLEYIQKPLTKEPLEKKGKIRLFVERIQDSQSHYYASEVDQNGHHCYKIDKVQGTSEECSAEEFGQIKFDLEFIDLKKINDLLSDPDALKTFVKERFGDLGVLSNRERFNKLFTVTNFLGDNPVQLLLAEEKDGQISISMNIDCRQSKAKMKEFSKLGLSQKTVFLMMMIVIGAKNKPIIIDNPEGYLDNDDIVGFLVPLFKKFKGTRQVILVTSNSLLGVNADPENYVWIDRTSPKIIKLRAGFTVDTIEADIDRKELVKIFDGSRREINKRAVRYKNI